MLQGIKAVLFDLDGTLLPMDLEEFTKGYFGELTKVLAPLGIAPQDTIDAVWAGTRAMVANDGSQTNEEAFWRCFAKTHPDNLEAVRAETDRFYDNEFHRARAVTGENPLAQEAVRLARRGGRRVVLATNPIFPGNGQASRLSWIGLKPEDFELVTAYETERYCKPNPQYYTSICERIGVAPQQCLMVGNDENEDMFAAASVGMQGYLVTDCRIASEKHPWTGASGSFAELVELLKEG